MKCLSSCMLTLYLQPPNATLNTLSEKGPQNAHTCHPYNGILSARFSKAIIKLTKGDERRRQRRKVSEVVFCMDECARLVNKEANTVWRHFSYFSRVPFSFHHTFTLCKNANTVNIKYYSRFDVIMFTCQQIARPCGEWRAINSRSEWNIPSWQLTLIGRRIAASFFVHKILTN